MKHLGLIFTTSLATLVGVAVSCARDADGSAETQRRVQECGVETWVKVTDGNLCGWTNRTGANAACGVASYKKKQDKACPGYVPYAEVQVAEQSTCPSGFVYTERILIDAGCEDCNKARVPRYARKCVRAEVVPTCRLPAFGVEAYKSCAHPNNGRDPKTCFDYKQPVYKDCEIEMTQQEIRQYLSDLESMLGIKGKLLVANEGLIAQEVGGPNALACTLMRWDGDVIVQDLVDELKAQYATLTGTPYTHTSCVQGIPPAPACDDGQASALCQAVRANRDARAYLSETIVKLERLRTGIVAKSNAEIESRLQEKLKQVAKFAQ